MKNVLGVFCNYAKNDRGKKIITVVIALTSINKFCPETANSAETIKQIPNTTLVEHFFTSDFEQANDGIYFAKTKTPNNSFQDIAEPLLKNINDDYSSQENL